jgi:formylmethanofuran dehydrogenase subunit B
MVIERIMTGVLTDEDLELYSAAREVIHGADLYTTSDLYGIAKADIECLVEELKELEAHYAQMAIAAITDLRKE